MKRLFNLILIFIIIFLCINIYQLRANNKILLSQGPQIIYKDKIIYKDNAELNKQINILSSVIDVTVNMEKCKVPMSAIDEVKKRINDLQCFNKIDLKKLQDISNEGIKQDTNKK